ncbi:MAG: hypothetical protein OXN83_04775 [Oligoflexia bacterium]|nr:hypothetical protein [Oligoflexia bacterium]
MITINTLDLFTKASFLIKALKSKQNKKSRRFNFKSLYQFVYKLRCEQVLNRLKITCPQHCPQGEQGKKSYISISLKLPTLKALCLKAFKRIWILKGSAEVTIPNKPL